MYVENLECKNKVGKYTCEDLYNCCDCGGNDCSCPYCWTCNACEVCKEKREKEF